MSSTPKSDPFVVGGLEDDHLGFCDAPAGSLQVSFMFFFSLHTNLLLQLSDSGT